MTVTLDLYQLKNLCMEMSELGAANYAKKIAPGKDLISQRQAYAEFGESRVKRWVSDRIVKGERMGTASRSKVNYSRAELMAAHAAEQFRARQIMTDRHQ